jgi:hypothetical protein
LTTILRRYKGSNEMKRTHDKFYADEVDSAPIKDAFKFIAENLKDFRGREVTLGDIGCAVGL